MARTIIVTGDELIHLVNCGLTVFQVAERLGCSKNTVKNYLKKYQIQTPKGFYSNGLPLGRRPGTPMTDHRKKEQSRRFSGEGNPFHGKTHNLATRIRMSENHADFTGDNNPLRKAIVQNPQISRKLSKAKENEWAKLSHEEKYRRSLKPSAYQDISGSTWANIRGNAATRGIDFSITPADAWQVWIEQQGLCALTGVSLNIRSDAEITASLDRIDNAEGYVNGNIQWLHKHINIMKNSHSQDDFTAMCLAVAEHHYGSLDAVIQRDDAAVNALRQIHEITGKLV